MKTIRIFAFPTHGTLERTTGVDFARIIQPMKYLNGYSDGEVKFEVETFDPKTDDGKEKKTDWLHVAKTFDIFYFNYLPDAWGFAAMGAMARGHNRKLVLDIDDSLWDLKDDNSAHSVYHKGSEALSNFTAMCNEVDYMTCTTSYLKNIILNNTYKRADKVKVFPNFIDLDLYKHRSPFKDNGQIKLLHYGSTTHFNDLASEEFAKGVDRIMQEYPNVSVKFVGAFLPKYQMRWGARFKHDFGHVNIYDWIKDHFPKFMDEADILVCPLTDDKYNRCKSNIKFLETSSAKIPGVWQNLRQYSEIVDGKNGFLANTQQEWYESIKKLIDDAKLRKEMGESAFKTIEQEWTIQKHVSEYAEFFKAILTT